jgi:hypothetical protein
MPFENVDWQLSFLIYLVVETTKQSPPTQKKQNKTNNNNCFTFFVMSVVEVETIPVFSRFLSHSLC